MYFRAYKILIFALIIFSKEFIREACAQEKSELQKKSQVLKTEIKRINLEIQQNKKQSSSTLDQLNTLSKKIKIRNELIETIQKERKKIEGAIGQREYKISELQKELILLKDAYKNILIKAYKNKSLKSSLLLLSSESIAEAFKRMKYLKTYIDFQKDKATKIREKQISLGQHLKQLQQENKQKKQVMQSQEKEKHTLESEKTEQSALAEALQKKQKNLIAIANKKQKQARELDRQIQALIAREIRLAKLKAEREAKRKREEAERARKAQGTLGKKNTSESLPERLSSEESALAANFIGNKGRLPWPVAQGIVVNHFGRQAYPDLEGIFIDNSGVDIRTSRGAQARAVFEGIVSAVYSISGGGQALLIQHGNYYTVYNNLQEVYVHKGSKVKMNQSIGKVYTNSQGDTLLNFQVWYNTSKQNPSHWIKGL